MPLPRQIRQLVREAVNEQSNEPSRPLKRRKKKEHSVDPEEVVVIPDEVVEVISDQEPVAVETLGPFEPEKTPDVQTVDDQESDDDFDSDDFEDIPLGMPETLELPQENDEITVQVSIEKKKKQVNVVSREERHYRRFFHQAYLLGLLSHGYARNLWCNNQGLHEKIKDLITDKIWDLLHPEEDKEMPLRSTRKLLDGLKLAMEMWGKRYKVRGDNGVYMKDWEHVKTETTKRPVSFQKFVKCIVDGKGPRDIGAQGFVALMRSVGLNARLCVSLQPPDFTNLKPVKRKEQEQEIGKDLKTFRTEGVVEVDAEKVVAPIDNKFPLYWCEVWDKFGKNWITIDPICLKLIETVRHKSKLEPSTVLPNNIMRYVVGYDRRKGCKDITRRYAANYNSKTRKKRITKDDEDWYNRVIGALNHRKRNHIDQYEDDYFTRRDANEGIPNNVQDLKNHPLYVIEPHLKATEVLTSNAKQCGFIRIRGKDKPIKVYKRSEVLSLKSARAWYMEGRILRTGAKAYKTVQKPRRRRKFDDDEEDSTERLYSVYDTELYKPPSLGPEGEVPTNAYGNIDVYVPSMIPPGAVLIESSFAQKAAKVMDINFAPAVTGFKFDKGGAKPKINGIVVAEEFKEGIDFIISDLVAKDIEKRKREAEIAALQGWMYFISKLRIKARLNETHGAVQVSSEEELEDVQYYQDKETGKVGVDTGGGFFADVDDPELAEVSEPTKNIHGDQEEYTGGFYPEGDEECVDDSEQIGYQPGGFTVDDEPGGFIVDEVEDSVPNDEPRGSAEEYLQDTADSPQYDVMDNYDQFMNMLENDDASGTEDEVGDTTSEAENKQSPHRVDDTQKPVQNTPIVTKEVSEIETAVHDSEPVAADNPVMDEDELEFQRQLQAEAKMEVTVENYSDDEFSYESD